MRLPNVAVIVSILFSCNYDHKIHVDPIIQQAYICDSIAVTFSEDIFPVLNSHCIYCHQSSNPTSGVPLGTYNQIAKNAKNGLLVGVITKSSGFQPMPPNDDTLTRCEISKIKQWVNLNYPNT